MRSWTEVAGIAQPATTRAEFGTRVLALGDVISNMNIGDEALPNEPTDEQRTGSINRMAAALGNLLPLESRGRADDGLRLLRAAVDIRNGFGHSGASDRLPRHFATFGLTYPPSEWGRAWDVVRARTIEALRQVRETIRQEI